MKRNKRFKDFDPTEVAKENMRNAIIFLHINRGISIQTMADRMGVDVSTINKIKNRINKPSFETVLKMLNAFGHEQIGSHLFEGTGYVLTQVAAEDIENPMPVMACVSQAQQTIAAAYSDNVIEPHEMKDIIQTSSKAMGALSGLTSLIKSNPRCL